MKKLVLILIFLGSVIPSFSQEIQLTEKEKEEAWEFIIKSFYLNKNFLKYPKIFASDINFHIENSQDNDKRVLQELLDDLSPVLKNKLAYVNDKKDANFTIKIGEGVYTLKYLPDTKLKSFSRSDDLYTYEVNNVRYEFYTNENFESEFLREKLIKKAVLQGLIGLQENRSSFDAIIENMRNYGELRSNSYLQEYASGGVNTERFENITPLDKYIIQIIYAPDFEQYLKNHIQAKLGFWGWMNFKYSESDLKMLRISLVAFIIILMLILAFKPLFARDFKSIILGYVLNSIYIAFIFIIATVTAETIQVYDFATIYLNEEFNHTANYVDIIKILVPVILIACVLFGLLLYCADYLILRTTQKIAYKFAIRILIFLGIGIVFFIVLSLILSKSKDGLSGLGLISIVLLVISLIRSSFLYFKERNENLIREKDLQLANITASKNEAEVASLHARINPHFLYNSLNAIASLAHTDADKTEKMALSLSDLFKHNLNRKNEASCTVNEEVDAVKAYLEIEKIRFGESLNYEIEVAESVKNYAIPRNIIQPLLENAIKHGVSQLQQSGFIKLKIHESQTDLIIAVYDNGPAFTDGLVSGYGLQSIYDILNFTYGDMAAISWQNKPEKLVFITIALDELKTSEA